MNEIPMQLSDDQSDRRLEEILSQVKYTGPEPMPSIDKLVADVADIIHNMRRERDDQKRQ